MNTRKLGELFNINPPFTDFYLDVIAKYISVHVLFIRGLFPLTVGQALLAFIYPTRYKFCIPSVCIHFSYNGIHKY